MQTFMDKKAESKDEEEMGELSHSGSANPNDDEGMQPGEKPSASPPKTTQLTPTGFMKGSLFAGNPFSGSLSKITSEVDPFCLDS